MRKTALVMFVFLAAPSYAASQSVDRTFNHATVYDVAGKIAGQCMNQGWTVTNQTSNQVTCQVPMNFGKQLLADLLLGSRYSTPTATYVQFNMAQIGDSVRAQARAWLENQSAFGQTRQSPVTDRKSQEGLLAMLDRLGAEVEASGQSTITPGDEPVGSSAEVAVGNMRFVESMAQSGHCDTAERFADTVKDPAITARVVALCSKPPK